MTGLTCEKFEWKLRIGNKHHHRQSARDEIRTSIVSLSRRTNNSTRIQPNLPELFRHEIKWFAEWKTIELHCSRDRVGAHVFPVDPFSDLQFRKTNRFLNAVETIAGGSPDGRREFLIGFALKRTSVEERRFRSSTTTNKPFQREEVPARSDRREHNWMNRKHHRWCNTCVWSRRFYNELSRWKKTIEEKKGVRLTRIDHFSRGDDVRGQSVGWGNVVSAGFGDNTNILVGGEMFIDRFVHGCGDFMEIIFRSAVARKTTSEIEKIHVETQFDSVIHDRSSILNGINEGFARHLSTAAMEAERRAKALKFNERSFDRCPTWRQRFPFRCLGLCRAIFGRCSYQRRISSRIDKPRWNHRWQDAEPICKENSIFIVEECSKNRLTWHRDSIVESSTILVHCRMSSCRRQLLVRNECTRIVCMDWHRWCDQLKSRHWRTIEERHSFSLTWDTKIHDFFNFALKMESSPIFRDERATGITLLAQSKPAPR